MEDFIEINGEKYVKREHKSPKINSKLFSMLMMGAMISGGLPYFKTSEQLSNIDIVKEYELILQKKSYLSVSERNRIKYQFEHEYKKKKNNE